MLIRLPLIHICPTYKNTTVRQPVLTMISFCFYICHIININPYYLLYINYAPFLYIDVSFLFSPIQDCPTLNIHCICQKAVMHHTLLSYIIIYTSNLQSIRIILLFLLFSRQPDYKYSRCKFLTFIASKPLYISFVLSIII